MIKLAIFASGGGSNANEICKYFADHDSMRVSLIVSNKTDAGVHAVAAKYNIPSVTVKKSQFQDPNFILTMLDDYHCEYIILAGFLLLIPNFLIDAFPKKILNIHPSLLPKYGGHGMYGHHVHDAVKLNNETYTGMTIHLVNDKYDEGEILFQANCAINESMASHDIATSVLELEHKYYSPTIENYIVNQKNSIKTN